MEKLLISNTPHIRASVTTRRIMIDVMIALVPATVAAIVFFGWRAALIIFLSLATCALSEAIFKLIGGQNIKQIVKSYDFTSSVTGLLLGLNFGSQTPWYVVVLSGVFAIIVVKMLFGGTGKNFVNPAIAGRVFAIISFGSIVGSGWLKANVGAIAPAQNSVPSLIDLFLGTGVMGSIGETSKLCLLIGGIYLVIRRVIDWKYPVIYIVLTGLSTSLIKWNISLFLPSILSGGLFLGAIFMATDYVTTPNTKLGNLIYFAVLGVLTGIFRAVTGGEVVSYCILLMNVTVPLIDRFIIPRPFGYEKKEKVKKEAR